MPKDVRSDDRLVEAMRAGDEAALGAVIERYTAYAGAVVRNIVEGRLDEADAKEILSDAFYALWKNSAKVRPGKLKAYLGRIARSRALDALRRAGRDVPLEDDRLALSLSGPEDALAREEEYAALRAALDALPEPDRAIFIRHYYFYQTTGDIAHALGLNVNTVQTKLRRGREKLRRELTERGYFNG